jgi:heptaprenylglyceryl phosphate synthase
MCGDKTLPVIVLDTILILSLLNSSSVLFLISPPYSLVFKILPVIPNVDTNVCKP